MRTLLFITSGFPVSGITEQSFILPELGAIAAQFERVILIPSRIYAGQEIKDVVLPDNCIVDDRYARGDFNIPKKGEMYATLLHPAMLKAILHDKSRLINVAQLRNMAGFYFEAKKMAKWLEKEWLNKGDNITIYTFWFHTATTAAAFLAKKHDIKIVTRAHGFDVYDDQVEFRSHYFREFTLNKINAVYTCSENCTEYLQSSYRNFSKKIKRNYLGTLKINQSFPNPSKKNEISLFTCARLEPVKRALLMLESLIYLSLNHEEIKINWTLIGDGSDNKKLREQILKGLPRNLEVKMLGFMENKKVQNTIACYEIDWYLSMSESEGLGLSMCEALSYGVPVIATNVGGVSEVVTDDVGILLSPNPDCKELAERIKPYIEKGDNYLKLRENAYKRWSEMFDATKLRESFAKEIANL